jgi:Fe-S oxidoreductase
VAEARATGARVLATACPYCAVMFEDAIKVLELEEEIAVLDVAELLAQSLQVDR